VLKPAKVNWKKRLHIAPQIIQLRPKFKKKIMGGTAVEGAQPSSQTTPLLAHTTPLGAFGAWIFWPLVLDVSPPVY